MMLAFPSSLGLEFEGAFVHGSPLSWIARNSSKPGRNAEAETWVLHASAEWTHAHLDEPAESIAQLLIEEFWPAIGLSATRRRLQRRSPLALCSAPRAFGGKLPV